MSALLEVNDLKVYFGGVRAVDGVTLEFEEGGLYGLVGPNGSGKSTFLGAVSRLTPMTSGQVRFNGTGVDTQSPSALARNGLARTFQTVRLVPSLTVLENVMTGGDARFFGNSLLKAWVHPKKSREAERRVREAAERALQRVGLEHLADQDPTSLPYGQQRRVEIARVLVGEPRMVLFDEPTAGMISEERAEIAALLRELQRGGVTQILVDHDVDLMVDVSDRLSVMDFGRLIASGSPTEVVSDPAVQAAYLGGG
jgi:ABC-type branched-subunit amino acid transport system ATPase component